jgi:Flp pilus assembly protein TadG
MSARAKRLRGERGQAIVFSVFALLTLVGMAAIVIDGGRWFQAQRHLQTAADAAALAGAQDLPNESNAGLTATAYSQQNYAGAGATSTFPTDSPCSLHACIDVAAVTTAPGFLAKIYGSVFSTVTVRAHARAMVSVPLWMKNVAPIAVRDTAACAVTNPGCYGQTVTVNFNESQVTTSTIGLINVKCYSDAETGCDGGQTGGSELKDEIECTPCYPNALPANKWYGVKTGETVGPVKQGLQDAADRGQILLFPVFDQVGNAGRAFHIIGWAAFVIDPNGVTWTSQNRQLTGHFITFIATDLAAGDPISGATDYGVHTITLTQ